MNSDAPQVQPPLPTTLAELHSQLAPLFSLSARKDLKTAVGVLARAFDRPDPEHCPLDHVHCPLPDIYTRVEDYLFNKVKKRKPMQPHTVRNTKNLLSRLFRFADAHHLWSQPSTPLLPRYDVRKQPRRPGPYVTRPTGLYLRSAKWPPNLQHDFTTFQTWATAPVVPGRASNLRKRPDTVRGYLHAFEAYFGFLTHIQLKPTLSFDDLFDITLITAFVHWHIHDLHHRPTKTIHKFLYYISALSHQYRPLPELRAQVAALIKTIPMPPPLYHKDDAWISLATLGEIGRTLWPQKKPHQYNPANKTPGLFAATHAGFSLMFRLWTYIPYRQRNMRDMLLDENLHKDHDGHWRITFHGEQLKIATKRGRLNVFDVPFPPELVPVLEEYLAVWRPVLLSRASHPDKHVFLTRWGNPYARDALTLHSKHLVYRYTGKHWHPHMVRTVWATEWIRNGGDFFKAAIMLNDTLETVIHNYAHLRDANVAEEVFALLDTRNGQGK